MKSLRFRAAAGRPALHELLTLAWRHSLADQRRAALLSDSVRVAHRIERDGQFRVPPGTLVTASVSRGEAVPAPPGIDILQRGADFCVVDKPAGWPSLPATPGGRSARALVANILNLPEESVWPCHRLDGDVSGAWLLALTQEAASRLSVAFQEGRVQKEYRALVPAPSFSSGRFLAGIDGKPAETRFETVRDLGPISELSLSPVTGRTHQLRIHLAEAGSPILGDPLYGGVALAGGLRLRSRRIAIESEGIDAVQPEPRAFVPPGDPAALFPDQRKVASIQVSDATISALTRGHPWILTDSETDDLGGFLPGTRATIHSASRSDPGSFLIEGPGRIAARRWTEPNEGADGPDIGQRVASALVRRKGLLGKLHVTSALRLIHGEADRLPGLMVDLLAGQLRVLLVGRSAEPLVPAVLAALNRDLPAWIDEPLAAVLVRHPPSPAKGEFTRVIPLQGEPGPEPFLVRERGLQFWVRSGLHEPARSRPGVDLYLDQRMNRQRIADQIERRGGGNWLNLFAHTGAFSVAALAAGAAAVTSVDLSAAYLAILGRNLEANRLESSRHLMLKLDSRRYLERLKPKQRFDGIILDPPTAAAGGKRFWSQKKELGELISLCLPRLAPGGCLLVCRNEHRARGPLQDVVSQAAAQSRTTLDSLKPADPSPDFPNLRGFPEGRAFEGILATVRG
ncbi:MAG: pseudouridine synthase [Planctomycetota bacterium]